MPIAPAMNKCSSCVVLFLVSNLADLRRVMRERRPGAAELTAQKAEVP